MRVISGKYKGLQLDGFNINGTRPTMDRVKESMFAMVQPYLNHSVCLDLFAGSGSLGIEALSNGAKYCYFTDNSNDIIKILKSNLLKTKANNYIILQQNYKQSLKKFSTEKIKFDLIILDPPYQLCLINDILEFIVDNDLLTDKGIVICEYENEFVNNSNLFLLKEKKYGSKNVRIYSTKK